jgi:uncharacterized protein
MELLEDSLIPVVPEEFVNFVISAMKSFKCSAHDEQHVFRVANLALRIAMALEPRPNLKIVYVAALSHDIMDSKLMATATSASSNEIMLRNELGQFLDSVDIEFVINIVKNIGYKNLLKEDWDAKSQSMEYRCVQDADLLDAIGASGIGRAFSFGGGRNRDLFGVLDNFNTVTREEYLAQQTMDNSTKGLSSAQHFFDKLLRIHLLMTTQTGKELASQRQETMLQYLRMLAMELEEAGSIDGKILSKRLSYEFPKIA